jgi:hypothetical protein
MLRRLTLTSVSLFGWSLCSPRSSHQGNVSGFGTERGDVMYASVNGGGGGGCNRMLPPAGAPHTLLRRLSKVPIVSFSCWSLSTFKK